MDRSICKKCRGGPAEVGRYCAKCTLRSIIKPWGWLDQWWFTATVTGGTRGGKPHRRQDKRKLLEQALRAYALTYGTTTARRAFSESVKAILLKSPKYRGFGTNTHRTIEPKGPPAWRDRFRNIDWAVRRIVTVVERRLRGRAFGRKDEVKLEEDNL